jgi:AcrR family transcriptional regulator
VPRTATTDRATPANDPAQLLRSLLGGFAERPGQELEAALDAALESFVRHGVGHTSVLDIARRLGVSKATAYRHVGSVDEALRLVVARELHGLVEELTGALTGARGVDLVLVPTVVVTRRTSEHPIFRKLLADEPHLLGDLLPDLERALAAATGVLDVYLDACMRAGEIRSSDHAALAEMIGHLMFAAVIIPPRDLDAYFRAALLPHLEVS